MDSDISMIGLGAMGTALAGALLKSGRKVTVWNRSPDKMAPLVAKGAIGAESLASAIGASPHSMICLMNYSATNTLFTDPNVAAATGDKSVVQLGTSTPEESEEAQALFGRLGAEYLDGTIMCWPGNIGTSTARIAVAGSRVAFSSCEKDLRILAEDLRDLGTNVRAAATLELAFLSRLLGLVFGSLHGALVCEAEGVPVSEFTAILPPGDRAIPLTEAIQEGSFETISSSGASVDVAGEAVSGLYSHAVSSGINSELPALMREWVKRAQAAGYGAQETSAVIKILRRSAGQTKG